MGWLVFLGFVTVGGGSVVGRCATDKRNPLFDAFLVGMYVGWVGFGVTAAVILDRRVPGDGGWGWAERFVLQVLACLGLFPLLYVGPIAIFGWNN